MRNPMFKEIQQIIEDKQEMKKLSRKFNYTNEIDDIYDKFDKTDEYDLDKMKREFDREGYDVGDWKEEKGNRPRFVELDDLEDDTDFQRQQRIENQKKQLRGALFDFFQKAVEKKKQEIRKEKMGEEGQNMSGDVMSNKVQLKDALAIGIRNRFLTVNEDEHVMKQDGGDDKHVTFIEKEDQGNGQGLQKFSDQVIVKNMREQGASEREIEEFRKLRSYSNSYRLRHVYRMFNEFKYQLNNSMTGFSETTKIQTWSNNFNYDAHLLELEKQEEEDRKKKQMIETKKLEAQAKMMGLLSQNIKAEVKKQMQRGQNVSPGKPILDKKVDLTKFMPKIQPGASQTMSQTQTEAEKIKKKLAAQFKKMLAQGDDISDGNSGIQTPQDNDESDDSTKNLDPRNKLFSFEKLRIKQEKMQKIESGDIEPVERDAYFKSMKFNQIKDFEEISLNNIDKYKKLKMLEDQQKEDIFKQFNVKVQPQQSKVSINTQNKQEADGTSDKQASELDSPSPNQTFDKKTTSLDDNKNKTSIDTRKQQKIDLIRYNYKKKGKLDIDSEEGSQMSAESNFDEKVERITGSQKCEKCGHNNLLPQSSTQDANSTQKLNSNKVNDNTMKDQLLKKIGIGLQKKLGTTSQKKGSKSLQEAKIQQFRQVQQQIRTEVDAYPELKIPIEFQARFEHQKKMNAGSVTYAHRQIQDEMRIRYLQQTVQQLEECHERDMKDIEMKLRAKMHIYVKECLEQIQQDLVEQFKLIFVQLDKINEKAKIQKRIIYELKNEMKIQEQIIVDLHSFIKWEEIEHDHFTQELIENGLHQEDITTLTVDFATDKNKLGVKNYYQKLQGLTQTDKDTIDIAKPFVLYSGNIRLKLHERLNIIERETVQLYSKKIHDLEYELDFYRSQSTDLNVFQDMLAEDKKNLEQDLADQEQELRNERNKRAIDAAKAQDQLKNTITDYELKIQNLSKDAEELYQLFVKELKLKDNILSQTIEIKDVLLEKTKKLTLKLKTPRHHLKFLEEKGMIDPFVSAKLTGEDVYAKWILKKAAKKEIDDMIKNNNKITEGFQKRQIHVDEFQYLKRVPGKSDSDLMGAGSPDRRFMVTSSFMNLNEDIKKNLSSIEFKEVPKPINMKSSPSPTDRNGITAHKVKQIVTITQAKQGKDTKHDGTVQKELASLNPMNSSSLYSNNDNQLTTFQAGVSGTQTAVVNDVRSPFMNHQNLGNMLSHPIQIHNQNQEVSQIYENLNEVNAIFPTYRGALTQRPINTISNSPSKLNQSGLPFQITSIENTTGASSNLNIQPNIANVFIFNSKQEKLQTPNDQLDTQKLIKSNITPLDNSLLHSVLNETPSSSPKNQQTISYQPSSIIQPAPLQISDIIKQQNNLGHQNKTDIYKSIRIIRKKPPKHRPQGSEQAAIRYASQIPAAQSFTSAARITTSSNLHQGVPAGDHQDKQGAQQFAKKKSPEDPVATIGGQRQKIYKGANQKKYKVGGSLIVGKLERKGSLWEGGFKQRDQDGEVLKVQSPLMSSDEEYPPNNQNLNLQPKQRFAETAQPGQRFQKNVVSQMDQNIISSDDELLDDKHLLTAHVRSDKEIKMPLVNYSQYNLPVQNNAMYQTERGKNFSSKYTVSNQIAHPQNAKNRKNIQLGKPMSTKDYFSQREQMKMQSGFYVKKPMVMDFVSSKKTRPSNKDNSLTNPQSMIKLDERVNGRTNKDLYRMSPDPNLSSELHHQDLQNTKSNQIYSGTGQSMNTYKTIQSVSRVTNQNLGKKSAHCVKMFGGKRHGNHQFLKGYQTHRHVSIGSKIDQQLIQQSLSPVALKQHYNLGQPNFDQTVEKPLNFLSARNSQVRSTVFSTDNIQIRPQNGLRNKKMSFANKTTKQFTNQLSPNPDNYQPTTTSPNFTQEPLNVQSMMNTPMDDDDDNNQSENENQRATCTNETLPYRGSAVGVQSDCKDPNYAQSPAPSGLVIEEQATISGVESLKARFTSSEFQVQTRTNQHHI